MNNPFTRPSPSPIKLDTMMAIVGFTPWLTIRIAAVIADTEPTAATERSIPPVRRTNVCPKATMITNAACLVNVLMLYAVKKFPVKRCTPTPARIVTINTIPAVDLKNVDTFFIIYYLLLKCQLKNIFF